jgi:PKD repeat protein
VENAYGSDSVTKTDYITVVEAPAFLSGWSYRKLVTIGGSPDGGLTDYQMRFVVHRSEGTDSGENVYLGTNVKEDYSDLRFTTIDHTQVSYWIESSDAGSAVVWVKVPEIPVTGTQMYVYYGNAGAAAVSDGGSTFSFFDDFKESAINATKWRSHVGTGASIQIIDGIARLTTGSGSGNRYAAIESKETYGVGYCLSIRQRSGDNGNRAYRYSTSGFGTDRESVMALSTVISGSDGVIWRDRSSGDPMWYARLWQGTANLKTTPSDAIATGYKKYEIARKSGGTDVEWFIDGISKGTHSNSKISSMLPLVIGIDTPTTTSGSSVVDYVDWVYVRKFSPNAPVVIT